MDRMEVTRVLNVALAPGGARKVWITFKEEIEPERLSYLLDISNDTFKMIDKRYNQLVNLSVFDLDTLRKAAQTNSWPADWPEGMKPRTVLIPFMEHQFIDTSKFSLELAPVIEQISIAP